MTQKEIFDYNKNCAEFLGWKETSEKFKIDWTGCKTKERLDRLNKEYIPILEKNGDVLFSDFSVMDFTKDWNCIMKVVEAIEKLESSEFYMEWFWLNETNIALYQRHKQNGSNLWEFIARFSNAKTKKEAVVQAINQFLIYHNENK